MISSSGPTVVVIAPVTSSAAGTSRSPRGPVTSTTAPRQAATAGSSAAGSAWARLPQTVPRLRSSRCPTKGMARPIRGTAAVQRVALHTALAHCGAEAQLVAAALDPAQFGERADVDERARPAQTHREHRDEELPAGEHLGITGGERLDGLGDRGGPVVGERRRLHVITAP